MFSLGPIGAHGQPIDVIVAWVVFLELVPLARWIRVVLDMEDPDDVLGADRAHTVHDIAVSLLIKLGSGIDVFGEFLPTAVVLRVTLCATPKSW